MILIFMLLPAIFALDLTILHNSNIQGRYDEISPSGGNCKDPTQCLAGFPRIAHVLAEERQKNKDLLYFNTGNTLIGTVWASFYNWTIAAEMLNALKPDAVAVGNHEFSLGIDNFAKFVKAAKFPVIGTNVDIQYEHLNIAQLRKHLVITRSNTRIGIVSYLEPRIYPGVVVTNERQAVQKECELLKEKGVDIIIALGHSALTTDVNIAHQVKLVDLIVGGHSKTFLWNGPKPDREQPDERYPFVITNKWKRKVPIVHAYSYGKYLGVFNVRFNSKGDLTEFHGQPILIKNSIPKDEAVLGLLSKYRGAVEEAYKMEVGKTKVFLDGEPASCKVQECNLGNLVAQAMVHYNMLEYTGVEWTDAPIALINAGFIRGSLHKGPITHGDVISLLPFPSKLIVLTLTGRQLLETIQHGFASHVYAHSKFLQFSGMQVIYNLVNKTVYTVRVQCSDCTYPHFEKLLMNKKYRVVTNNYIAQGADSFVVLQNAKEKKLFDASIARVTVSYIKKMKVVAPGLDRRISFIMRSIAVRNYVDAVALVVLAFVWFL